MSSTGFTGPYGMILGSSLNGFIENVLTTSASTVAGGTLKQGFATSVLGGSQTGVLGNSSWGNNWPVLVIPPGISLTGDDVQCVLMCLCAQV